MLHTMPDPVDLEQTKDLLKQCFHDAAAPDTIAFDNVTLPLLYKIVSTPTGRQALKGVEGTAGDWPPSKYR